MEHGLLCVKCGAPLPPRAGHSGVPRNCAPCRAAAKAAFKAEKLRRRLAKREAITSEKRKALVGPLTGTEIVERIRSRIASGLGRGTGPVRTLTPEERAAYEAELLAREAPKPPPPPVETVPPERVRVVEVDERRVRHEDAVEQAAYEAELTGMDPQSAYEMELVAQPTPEEVEAVRAGAQHLVDLAASVGIVATTPPAPKRKPRAKKCQVCGRRLPKPPPGRAGRPRRFCSEACQARDWRRRPAEESAPRCRECGEAVPPSGRFGPRTRIYCSRLCGLAAARRAYLARRRTRPSDDLDTRLAAYIRETAERIAREVVWGRP